MQRAQITGAEVDARAQPGRFRKEEIRGMVTKERKANYDEGHHDDDDQDVSDGCK